MVTTTSAVNSSSFDALQAQANQNANKKTSTNGEKAVSDYESFLLLMTTQMKNQDPLKPMDSTEFVSQLAQFSGVEQQVNMNKKLDDLIKNINGSQFDEAALYLGKYITVDKGKFEVTKEANPAISYKTDSGTVSANIEITDKTGALVRTIQVPPSDTTQKLLWDKLDMSGETVSDGGYQATIVSTSSTGAISRTPAMTRNKVSEVVKTDTGFDLKTNFGDLIALTDVSSLADSL